MFEREITKYYDEIYRYCYHKVGSRETAEDLCQDTFISFLESAASHTGFGSTKSYLYTIARNKCTDFYRKKKDLPVDDLESRLEADTPGGGTADFGEIATIMDVSVSKAKFLVARALELLKKEV